MIWQGKELVVFDEETNGLLYEVTKLHCLCYCKVSNPNVIYKLTTYEEIKEFFLNENFIKIGHNIFLYDILVAEKLLNIENNTTNYDTLALSWYLNPERNKHGLESYGEDFGVLKPVIKDWKDLTIEDYLHRCAEDVKINTILWINQYKHLLEIYNSEERVYAFLNYLSFKLMCVQDQMRVGIKLDVDLCKTTLETLETLQEQKVSELTLAMPQVPIKSVKMYPKKFYKQDGSISALGEKWMSFLKENNLPEDYIEPVEYIHSWEDPNPRSPVQIKKWLYNLGWIPEHFKFNRDKETGEIKQVEQTKHKTNAGEVCESVKKLFVKEPKLEILEGLGIVNHRITVFKGFLRDQVNGRLYGTMSGLTNTLRLQHNILVNLVSVDKAYGKEIRGCLIADDGCLLIGSDLKNIESMTRNHYIYPYDPEYVKELSDPSFDSHLDIAKLAGFLTEDQIEEHKNKIHNYNVERQKGKTVNFAAVYGVGAATLSRNSGLPIDECKKLLEVYWRRNGAVRKFAESLTVKEIRGQKWLFNPISKYWYSLRGEKDRFSTCNQSSAVFCFDIWLFNQRKLGVKAIAQFHDEGVYQNIIENIESDSTKIKKAIEMTNDMLKLNVKLDCSVDKGINYSLIH